LPPPSITRGPAGRPPLDLLLLKEARVVTALLPAANSNTVPAPTPVLPRYKVEPKRLPPLSITTPESGLAPLVALKVARVVMALLPAATSNTVPRPDGPPQYVVPKRLPLPSSTRPAEGEDPLVPLKVARVVKVPLPVAILNTVPAPVVPPL